MARPHRRRQVALVPILVQRQPRPLIGAVDEAGVGREAREPGGLGRAPAERVERFC
jgi:hypothetical protein